VRLDYRLSRSELLFERTPPGGYHAAYEVRVIFYTKNKRQVAGDTYTRQLQAASYSETRIRDEDIMDHLEFQVPPGKYRIEVVVTDLVAERPSGTAIEFEVPKTPPGLVWFSDVTLGAVEGSGGSSGGTHFVANPSRRYGNLASFAASGEIFDQRGPGQADSIYPINFKVLSDTGDQVLSGDTTVVRQSGRTPFLLRPHVRALGPGSYRFVVALTTRPLPGAKGGKPNVVRRDKPFEVEQSPATIGFASTQSLDVLRYISTQQEIDDIEKVEKQGEDARRSFWENFWKRRDPTPETPENEALSEFYQRVAYSNQHFSTGGMPGWKSDMGRIYILYGRPDEVERYPFNFDKPPEERWHYYRDRRTFIFVDRDGFGRYELVAAPNSP